MSKYDTVWGSFVLRACSLGESRDLEEIFGIGVRRERINDQVLSSIIGYCLLDIEWTDHDSVGIFKNVRFNVGDSLLHLTARNSHWPNRRNVVEALLKLRINTNLQNCDGETAADIDSSIFKSVSPTPLYFQKAQENTSFYDVIPSKRREDDDSITPELVQLDTDSKPNHVPNYMYQNYKQEGQTIVEDDRNYSESNESDFKNVPGYDLISTRSPIQEKKKIVNAYYEAVSRFTEGATTRKHEHVSETQKHTMSIFYKNMPSLLPRVLYAVHEILLEFQSHIGEISIFPVDETSNIFTQDEEIPSFVVSIDRKEISKCVGDEHLNVEKMKQKISKHISGNVFI